ncbi:glucosidase 2 subunit beta [Rhynchophorus ferrugineus]|uniref:glucosidase 2 subunit beta n=1 Tax=Rhynchophorus ferrugineus TaxID=354439 RepID=UPI003FCD38B6
MDVFKIYSCFKIKCLFFLIFLVELSTSSVEIPRPRGVSLSRAGLYDPEKDFTCLDGSKTIPYDQVNDDYCDCNDSSDEPGTNACANGSFYCLNAGYKPQILASNRVNDGICDCCDGADEYTGRKSCINNCLEIGRAAREEAARYAELLKIGKQMRTELSQQGKKIKNEKQAKLNELRKNKEEAEKIKTEKEELKKQAEEVENKALEYYRELEEQHRKQKAEKESEKLREEAVDNFNKLDSNQDGLIDTSEIQTRQTFDRDRNGEVTEEEAKIFLDNQDSADLETFIEKSWPLMKPFVTLESGMFKPPALESEAEDLKENDEQNEYGEGDHEAEEEEEEEESDDKAQHEDIENEEHITYDEETQKLVDIATEARSQLADSEKEVRNINDEIRDIEQSLKKDFGPDEEFATLEGQCFEYSDREYIYKLCPFDKTVQIPKSNSLETNLGRWSKWDGPNNNPYGLMFYDHGQNCWNGPNRTTKVKVTCGTENKLISVSEPNRCEYAFEFQTPAACRELSNESGTDLHDEL